MTRSRKRYHLAQDYHLLAYETLDSTNEEAKRLAEHGAAHGAVIWAKEQTDGRGRYGRKWESPNGNLFVSILLSPEKEVSELAQLSFVTAVAAAEALQPMFSQSAPIACKWPNDIMLNDRKLGGILLESFKAQSNDRKCDRWVVSGLGINIDHFPIDTRYPATSLKAEGLELVSAKIVLSRFLDSFMNEYDAWLSKGFAPVRKKWLTMAYGLGQNIEVQNGHEIIKGRFSGLSNTGELQIEVEKSNLLAINSGDVFFHPLKAVSTHINS